MAHRPLSSVDVAEKRRNGAILRYFDARLGRDIAISCYFEGRSTWQWILWNWNEGSMNKALVQCALLLHISIPFLEPASLQDLQASSMPNYCLIPEFFCIVIEFQDAIIRTILTIQALPVREDSVEDLKDRLITVICLDICIIAVFIDLLLSISLNFSFEYYIPIKVAIILLELKEVRTIFQAFAETIAAAKDVFFLYFSVIVISSAMGHILFRHSVNVDSIADSWFSFVKSFITAFIFISTGDNYTNCVYPSFEASAIYGEHIYLLRQLKSYFLF